MRLPNNLNKSGTEWNKLVTTNINYVKVMILLDYSPFCITQKYKHAKLQLISEKK